MHGLSDLIGLVETKVRSGKAARITRCLGKDCNKAITVENEAGNGRIENRKASLQRKQAHYQANSHPLIFVFEFWGIYPTYLLSLDWAQLAY